MRLHRLALATAFGLFFTISSSTSARAAYTWTVTSPSAPFTVHVGGTLAVGGTVGWTYWIDTTVAYVKIKLHDDSDHENSTWAPCSVGWASTTFGGTISAGGLNVCGDGPRLSFQGYDSAMNALNTGTLLIGAIK